MLARYSAAKKSGIAVLLFCSLTAPRAQDVCEAFAKYGVYDTSTTTSDVDKASSFRSWFCQNKFESKAEADAAGGTLGYGGFNIGYDQSSESWSQFSSNYCRDDTYNSRYREKTSSFVRTINANASNNMLMCFMRGGLHARIVQGARPDTFYVQARMNPVGPTTEAGVKSFQVIGATCTGPLQAGYLIRPGGVEQICQRAGVEAVDVSLSTTDQVNWDTPRGLKAITPPPPPLKKQAIAIRAQDFVRGTNVAIDQCVAGPGVLANAPPCNPAPNAAEFDFDASAPGKYRLLVNFTAAASRPVKVFVNKELIRDQALSETTGSWLNTNLRWTEVGPVSLKQGRNTLRLERSDVFPHIQGLTLEPIPE